MKIIRYGELTDKKKQNIVGPNRATLHVQESLSSYCFPLLSFDLQECGKSESKEKLMFVYAEYSETDENGFAQPLQFKVNENGSYLLDSKSTAQFIRFRDEVQLPFSSQPKKWKGKFIDIVKVSLQENMINHMSIREAIQEIDPSVGIRNFPIFHDKPEWIQNPGNPLNPDGKPMKFIGQLGATYLTMEAADYEFYLFYCPNYRIVKQFAQIT